MFIDPDQWTDEDLFVRVREGEDIKAFLSSPLGRKIMDAAKERHKMAVIAITQVAVEGFDLDNYEDKRTLEKILRDIAAPSTVLQYIQELLVDADKSEAILRQRDIEDS